MRKLILALALPTIILVTPRWEASQFPHPMSQHKPHAGRVGLASWYGGECRGDATASGQPFDEFGLTAAKWGVPLGSKIKVTNLKNKKSIILKVNDRGPSPKLRNRIVDVSMAAAQKLGFLEAGLAPVRVEVVNTRK